MSALVTPTFESMKQVVNLLEERNLRQGRYVITPTPGPWIPRRV